MDSVSWIRNHIRHYVVPGIKPLRQGHNVLDAKRSPINMRPAKGFPRKEFGLIWAACKCFGVQLSPSIEHMLRSGRPNFGYRIASADSDDRIHNIVKNSSKALRRIMRTKSKLILPGRDVWLWSIMCHKMGIDHIFDPRVSRRVSGSKAALQSIIKDWKLNCSTVIFDTGFAGSIYERIIAVSGVKCVNLMLSTQREREQIFPNHKGARTKALAIEYLPKYQKTGTVANNQPIQYMADIDEFIHAAVLTIWFWYHESPAWIDQGGERYRVVDCFCKSCKLWKGAPVPALIHDP